MACGKKTVFESVTGCSSNVYQSAQSMAWVAVVINEFLCFPKELCVVDALHGWEMAADDAFRCLHHPLEGLAISSGRTRQNAAREDALNGAPVKVTEGFLRYAKLLESPQEVKVLLGSFSSRVRSPVPGDVNFDEHTEELEAGNFLHFSPPQSCRR